MINFLGVEKGHLWLLNRVFFFHMCYTCIEAFFDVIDLLFSTFRESSSIFRSWLCDAMRFSAFCPFVPGGVGWSWVKDMEREEQATSCFGAKGRKTLLFLRVSRYCASASLHLYPAWLALAGSASRSTFRMCGGIQRQNHTRVTTCHHPIRVFHRISCALLLLFFARVSQRMKNKKGGPATPMFFFKNQPLKDGILHHLGFHQT